MSERALSGELKKCDLVKVTGCYGDIVTGKMNFSELYKPKSIQLETTAIIGEPTPLANANVISQRKRNENTSVSLDFSNSNDSFDR